MKSLKTVLLSFFPVILFSQVIINPGNKTSPSSPAVSLEFGDGDNRGIVMPYVTQAAAVGAVDGTVIMDPQDKAIKIKINGSWQNYSGNASKTGVISTALQDGKDENLSAKIMIGGNPATDNVPGILVLADTNKAMILPRVASPHLNIKNPAPGMMAFDTVKKQLALFNGTQWSFWKQD